MTYFKGYKRLEDGIPCNHPGCLSHVTHPCEGCGRTAGRYTTTGNPWEAAIEWFRKQKEESNGQGN